MRNLALHAYFFIPLYVKTKTQKNCSIVNSKDKGLKSQK